MSIKRYRYRAYPKKGQQQPIAALFGCVRVVYNDALAYSEEQYKDTGKKPSSKRAFCPAHSPETDPREGVAAARFRCAVTAVLTGSG